MKSNLVEPLVSPRSGRDEAINNALTFKHGKSFTDGNVIVGTGDKHVCVSFNETLYNRNCVLILHEDDAKILLDLLTSAGKQQG